MKRIASVGAGVVLLALLVAWWLLHPTPWTVSLAADDSDVAPWAGVNIVATVAPPNLDRSRFHYHWFSDGDALAESRGQISWRSGKEGTHHVEVVVEGPSGVTHRARVDVSVYARDFVGVTGTTMPRRVQPQANPSLSFAIADVWLEKNEVCRGESDRIRLRPFHQGGPSEEKWLRPSINGEPSWEVTYTPTLVPPGLQQIRIVLTDDKKNEDETFAYIKVKDCIAPHPMFVHYESVAPDPEYIAFTALIFNGPEWQAWARDTSPNRGTIPRATPAKFVWHFGDDQTRTSTEPFVRHRYPSEARRSNERATSYPVQVEALDADGQELASATTSVTLLNVIHGLARQYATLQLLSEQPPGPATKLDDGSRTVQVTLRNIDPTETAHMSSFVEKFIPCDAKEPTVQSLAPSTVFSTDAVGPSSAITGTFTVPPGQDEICSVAVEIQGKSTPGDLRVTGVFALDTGNRKGHELTPEQMEVFAKARTYLDSSGIVTAADIRRLEDEGVIPRGVVLK